MKYEGLYFELLQLICHGNKALIMPPQTAANVFGLILLLTLLNGTKKIWFDCVDPLVESERLHNILLWFNVILLELNKRFNFLQSFEKLDSRLFDLSWNIFNFFFLEVKDFDFIYNATNSVYNTMQFQKVKDPESMDYLCPRDMKNYKRQYAQ